MFIKPKANAGDLWDINQDIAMEALLYSKGDFNPLPWDATIEVKGDKVILEGSILGSSANTYTDAGYCKCEISVAKFPRVYELELPDSFISSLSEEDLQALWDAGWERA